MASETSLKIPAYYFGGKAIAQRLGYKSPRIVQYLAKHEGLLVHKRIRRSRTGTYRTLAISEPMVQLWEAARGLEYRRQRLRSEEE